MCINEHMKPSHLFLQLFIVLLLKISQQDLKQDQFVSYSANRFVSIMIKQFALSIKSYTCSLILVLLMLKFTIGIGLYKLLHIYWKLMRFVIN